ncbi:MAG TPA: hypothetical protein VG777_06280 [Thermoanaerobaculia bacterium]|nr:hypothetical protein [Thermoanaerobaculia bacterium]
MASRNPIKTAKLRARAPMDVRKVMAETVGERKNYNFQPEVTEYRLWPFSTIEWVAEEGKFKARAMVQNKTTNDIVVFNSWHAEYDDAERPIALLSDSLNGRGDRKIYNIWAETTEVHTSDIGGGDLVNVTETLALIWSMDE